MDVCDPWAGRVRHHEAGCFAGHEPGRKPGGPDVRGGLGESGAGRARGARAAHGGRGGGGVGGAMGGTPAAPPICWDVLIRPLARPASRSATPPTAAIVTDTKERPRPTAASSDGPRMSAAKPPFHETCPNQINPAAMNTKPLSSTGLKPRPLT